MKRAAWIGLVLLLTACGDKNAELHSQFVAGCKQGGSRASACECLWGKLAAAYTPEQLEAYNRAQVPPAELTKFKQVAMDSAYACRNE